jgi:hypothetical protein
VGPDGHGGVGGAATYDPTVLGAKEKAQKDLDFAIRNFGYLYYCDEHLPTDKSIVTIVAVFCCICALSVFFEARFRGGS